MTPVGCALAASVNLLQKRQKSRTGITGRGFKLVVSAVGIEHAAMDRLKCLPNRGRA